MVQHDLFVSFNNNQQRCTNQQHFVYLDSAGTIWDAWWDGDCWQVQQINSTGWQKIVPGVSANQATQILPKPPTTPISSICWMTKM